MTRRNAAEAFEGWVSIGLLLLPGIPLWFFWDELQGLSGGYREAVVGVAVLAQPASVMLLREPLMRRVIALSDKFRTLRRKRHSDRITRNSAALEALQENLRETPAERVRELAAYGADLARQDREQNVRVALAQMMDREAGAKPSRLRFFLVDRSIPALEPKPGSMLLLGSDGTWSGIVPSEVLGDEGSPEVSEETFVSTIARLGSSMPNGSRR